MSISWNFQTHREDSPELWTKEIIRFKEYLEKTFNVEITEEKVRHAVHVSNPGTDCTEGNSTKL